MKLFKRAPDSSTATRDCDDEFEDKKREAQRRTEQQRERLEVVQMYARQAGDAHQQRRRSTDHQAQENGS